LASIITTSRHTTAGADRSHNSTGANRSMHRPHAWKLAAAIVLVSAVTLVWAFRRPWFYANLGVVDAGRVIRSAQPTTQLARWIRDYHLQSILNLRGGELTDSWYRAEVETANAGALAYYDLPLSATRRPTRRELLMLIDVLEHCRYPLLIHCKSGADRTGLASALYRIVKRGESPVQAATSFSYEFGHIPIGGTEHLHEPLAEYSSWLNARRLASTPERFRDWIKNQYRAPDPPVDPPMLMPGPRVHHTDAQHVRAPQAAAQ
jgi:protein tyrosine phosphatase (PTP) superfamily phosphohydrolase (DUF442 family)